METAIPHRRGPRGLGGAPGSVPAIPRDLPRHRGLPRRNLHTHRM